MPREYRPHNKNGVTNDGITLASLQMLDQGPGRQDGAVRVRFECNIQFILVVVCHGSKMALVRIYLLFLCHMEFIK